MDNDDRPWRIVGQYNDYNEFKNSHEYKPVREVLRNLWNGVLNYELDKFPSFVWTGKRKKVNGFFRRLVMVEIFATYLMRKFKLEKLQGLSPLVSIQLFKDYKLNGLLRWFRTSPTVALMTTYPNEFKIWEFQRVTVNLYNHEKQDIHLPRDDIDSREYRHLIRSILKDLCEHYEVIYPDDLPHLSSQQYGMIGNILHHFEYSKYVMLNYFFPGRFQKHEFSKLPQGKRSATKKEIHKAIVGAYGSLTDREIYQLSADDLEGHNFGGYLQYYGDSNIDLLIESFASVDRILEKLYFHNQKQYTWTASCEEICEFLENTSDQGLYSKDIEDSIEEIMFMDEYPSRSELLSDYSEFRYIIHDLDEEIAQNTGRELIYLLAADLGYDNPREDFMKIDLSLRGSTQLIVIFKSISSLRNEFPDEEKWLKIRPTYRKRLGLHPTQLLHSTLAEDKEELIHKKDERYSSSDFKRVDRKSNQYRCPLKKCSQTVHKNRRIEHLRDVHNMVNVVRCKVKFPNGEKCGIMVRNRSELKIHKQIHKKLEYPCSVCDETFPTPSDRNLHERRVCIPEWKCMESECSDLKPFHNQTHFDNHKTIKHGKGQIFDPDEDLTITKNSNGKYDCPLEGKDPHTGYICDNNKGNGHIMPNLVNKHIKGKHKREKPYQCHCFDKFENKKKLSSHGKLCTKFDQVNLHYYK